MSTLWTPSGEHPVDPERQSPSPAPPGAPLPGPGTPGAGGGGGPTQGGPTGGPGGPGGPGPGPGPGPGAGGPGPEEAEQLEALRHQLAEAPAEVVIANHCFGLFELAAVYLSMPEPQLDGARLAIDALGSLIEGLAGRLGEAEPSLNEGLAQLRLAFVQIDAAHRAPQSTQEQHQNGG